MALKVAINGFGRIGRSLAKVICERDDIELVALNDIATPDMMHYLLKYDTVHGIMQGTALEENYLIIGKDRALLSHKEHPRDIDFSQVQADVVFECSGKFLTTEEVGSHIDKGCKKVIISAPSIDETPTFVLGVNEKEYRGEKIISNASCTTNCLGSVAKILDENFGIEKGLITTIHSYTNDQHLLDVKHRSDRRRARAAAVNMIPTTTGAAKAMKLIMPHLKEKLHGQSVRVPVPNVSMMDFNVLLGKETTAKQINELFIEHSKSDLKGILAVDDSMKVSSDLKHNTNSAIVALDLTQIVSGNMAKVMVWYDNEWGYSNRLAEMALYIS